MKIDFAKLQFQYQLYKNEIDQRIQDVLNKSNYIMGEEIELLEEELKNFTQSTNVVTCSSGTDALLLAMMSIDIQPEDEIITTPFTFVATAETIALMHAKPVFVDIEDDTYNIDASKIEAAITDKTKAIMPVSLYGQPADMEQINRIANQYSLKVIIDGAQSFGATYRQQQEVHYCDIYTTSFFPAKPLGCYGDGGAVFTNNNEYAEKIKMMRVHGQNKRYHHKYIGMGGRLDTIQAAVILAKLPHYAKEIAMRQTVAENYTQLIKENYPQIKTPFIKPDNTSVFAQYTIQVKNRDKVQKQLKDAGIPTAVHYPMPLHKQECFQYLNQVNESFAVAENVSKEVISLPMNPFINDEEIKLVIAHLS